MAKTSAKKLKLPDTIDEFAKWLRIWIANVESYVRDAAGFGDDALSLECDCEGIVADASKIARRLGIGRVAQRPYPARSPSDAIAALGSMLTACEAKTTAESPPAELTVKQAAKLINVAERTIYDLVQSKVIPHKRYGTGRGTVRIPRDGLLDYQERQTIAAKSQPGEITLEYLRSL